MCLTDAVNHLARCAAGPGRDRREIVIRLERGFLTSAADVATSGEGPADFERCLQLAGNDLQDDELFLMTLTALVGYYHPRAELRRCHDLLATLSHRIGQDRLWGYPAIESSLGTVRWLEGDFDSAREHLQRALADRSAADPHALDAAWFVATDPIAVAHSYLALTHVVHGDLDRAETDLTEAQRRSDGLDYPRNAFNRAFTYFAQIWVRLEANRIDEAAASVAGLCRLAEESGLDLWRLVGATERSTVKALAALAAGADAASLTARAEKIAAFVDASRGMHLNAYIPVKDAIIARLLIAAGQPDRARERLEMALGLAEDTGMHYHDAELMRLRAHTFTNVSARRATLGAALDLARRHGATLFELRCLLDSFDLLGDGNRSELAHVVERFPGDSRWPERARAQRILS